MKRPIAFEPDSDVQAWGVAVPDLPCCFSAASGNINVVAEKPRNWGSRHCEFIDAYNASVKAEGLPLRQWRAF